MDNETRKPTEAHGTRFNSTLYAVKKSARAFTRSSGLDIRKKFIAF